MSRQLATVVLVAVLAGGIGWWAGHRQAPAPAAANAQAEPAILYYRNPMGLPDTSPVPKKDSMGMDYVPVYAGEAPATPGTVVVTPERVQASGVRVAAVSLAPLAPALRFPAVLAVDEAGRRAIAPRYEGWVQQLVAGQTGLPVRRGQLLMTVYSPDFLAAQQEYLVAQRAQAALAAGDSAARMGELAQAALQHLRHFEVGAATLERLRRGELQRELAIHAPIDGVVTARPVLAGARFMAGESVLELTDLSVLWAVAQVPARESARLAAGMRARFRSEALPGRDFEGAVVLLAPTLDAATRTLAVRVELANPDGVLRPELYGEIEFVAGEAAPVLQVPRSALLDSGPTQRVFVELAPGRYEPRVVRVGRREGEAVEILDGLTEGERIVVSGNFLIDAESRLGEALEAPTSGPGTRDPGLGKKHESRNPEAKGGHEADAGDEPASPGPGSRVPGPDSDPHSHHRGA